MSDKTPVSINEVELLNMLEDEFALTVCAYKSLVNQCHKLADAMGYNDDYILRNVMPKTLAERTDTDRIIVWFDKEKDKAVEYLLKREAAREKECARKMLLESLNLTSQQKALLDLPVE